MIYSKQQAVDNLKSVLRLITGELIYIYTGVKTVDYYQRVLWGNVRDLYNDKMSEDAFIDDLVRLIDEQLRRAWNQGMRENDLDPERDMTPEWEDHLQEIMTNELDYVETFARDIREAADNGEQVDQFRSRVDIWTNRYNEVVNDAKVTTRPEDRFKWVFGDTIHCSTCAALNGIIATAKQWDESGYKPQSPPNDKLECGGWHCQCQYEYTEEPVTEGGIPDV